MSAPDNDKKPRPPGRVRHDATGRAVWEWAVESGRHAIESTSRLLKKLEIAGLSLADEDREREKNSRAKDSNPYGEDDPTPPKREVPTFGGRREADPAAQSRRSFDPYDNRAPPKRGAAKPAPRPTTPRVTQPPREGRKPGLLSRLLGRKY